MVENMFFLDSEHIGMGRKCWFIQFITGSIQWRGGQVQMVLDSPPIPPKEYPCYFINPLKWIYVINMQKYTKQAVNNK